ncbi:MAG: uridine kinase [bacterium]
MEPTDQRIFAFHEAIVTIAERAHAVVENGSGRRVVVGVTGAVASGKSTLARRLADHVVARDPSRRMVVLSTDHYLPDYEQTAEHLRDLPESSDLARLAGNLAELRAGRATHMPQWSFDTHARVGELLVEPAEVVIVEGLHALHALPRAHVDIAVYIEAPREVRWDRAVERERSGERPWPIEYLRHFFHNVAEPSYERHAALYRDAAHVIVRNEG